MAEEDSPGLILAAGVLQGKLQTELLVEAARVLGVADQEVTRIVKLSLDSKRLECDFRANARDVAQ